MQADVRVHIRMADRSQCVFRYHLNAEFLPNLPQYCLLSRLSMFDFATRKLPFPGQVGVIQRSACCKALPGVTRPSDDRTNHVEDGSCLFHELLA